ncbi:NADH:flavin oxidoreductase/NADH oxidase [Anaerobacillus sp. MEB173]|uniref:NADH:flavin oxidoreductase/NADH oxidase n=1 Tax=Anaerobacillus sp. MEB173 TaxID=3383345 RepID=UPI003F939223
MANLFSPITIKNLELKNRIVLPPMCQYSVQKKDGIPNDWHFVHYTSRAVGGAGLIIVEMTDVEPDGRISDFDLGLWSDDHIPAFARIVDSCHNYGAKTGIQIAHAGRKAQDAKVPVSSTTTPFDDTFNQPKALTTDEIKNMVEKFRKAAKRAMKAGFDTIELHGAHGYLIHQFHSPFINQRSDEYGKDLSKFGVEVIQAIKSEMPAEMPLIMRVSAKEYVRDGYDVDHMITICKEYKKAGVDVFHVSSGGEAPLSAAGNMGPHGRPSTHAGYQVPFARKFKETFDIPIIAVGKLDNPYLANSVIGNGDADMVAVGRGMLRDPQWALNASVVLGKKIELPKQYIRGY